MVHLFPDGIENHHCADARFLDGHFPGIADLVPTTKPLVLALNEIPFDAGVEDAGTESPEFRFVGVA